VGLEAALRLASIFQSVAGQSEAESQPAGYLGCAGSLPPPLPPDLVMIFWNLKFGRFAKFRTEFFLPNCIKKQQHDTKMYETIMEIHLGF
jgi:hypothetical protein